MTQKLIDIVKAMPEEAKRLFQEELKKFQSFLQIDVKTLTPEQISTLLAKINTEKSALSVKLIQLETQIQEKQKELDKKIQEIFKKYNITDLSFLEEKKREVEKELEDNLALLKTILATEEVKNV